MGHALVPLAAATARGFAWVCIGYFVLLNSAYLMLLALAAGKAVSDRGRVRFAGLPEIFASPLAPPISLIVPVRNMADLIVGSIRGLLGLRYPEFEVIVVDDGSTDATFGRLQAAFGLVPVDKVIRNGLTTAGRVISVHAPCDGSNLLVIRKQGAGHPPDAVDVGVNAARYPLVCRIDSGTYLDTDALLTVAKPFVEDPARVVAASATIRVANGSQIRDGRVTGPRVAGGWLLPIQTAEYLRSFLLGRAGWSQLRGMLSIPGVFGVYRRDIYELAGRSSPGSDRDDLEMTIRIHQRLRDERQPYRIGFVPEPCCWTVVPGTYRRLAQQRARWSRNLADALWAHRTMILNAGYGKIGLLVLPFYLVFELVSAVVELLAVAVFAAGLALGFVSPGMALLFVTAGLGYGAFLTLVSVIAEELTYHRYPSLRDFALLVYAAVAESAGFRQLHAWWRVRGLAGAVLRRGPAWAAEPGAEGQSGPAFGAPARGRHVQVR
jgi:cellulose synthase/poly-beta-1,6-N-acetylglucosamine synthase-like glycosyltransferase